MGFVKKAWNSLTGKTQAQAAERAGNVQADASRYAADLQKQMYDQSRADTLPWQQAGKQALGQLSRMVNGSPDFYDALGGEMHRNRNQGAYSGGLPAGELTADPSYQFRKQRGMDGIQASAAANGSLQSGATLKALNEYNSNLASQEYNNAWQRLKTDQNQRFNVDSNLRSQDYNLFNSENTRRYNQIANLAGVGQTANAQLSGLGQNAASNIGNATMQGANARAAGLVGSANARAGGYGNLFKLGGMVLGAM